MAANAIKPLKQFLSNCITSNKRSNAFCVSFNFKYKTPISVKTSVFSGESLQQNTKNKNKSN